MPAAEVAEGVSKTSATWVVEPHFPTTCRRSGPMELLSRLRLTLRSTRPRRLTPRESGPLVGEKVAVTL